MSKIKVGDEVRVMTKGQWCDGLIGRVSEIEDGNILHISNSEGKRIVTALSTEVEKIAPVDVTCPATAPVKTAVKALLDAKLYPQDKTILEHLKQGKPITPMKALTIYGFTRLAAQIRNIRKAGFNVVTAMREDEVGHKYAEYRLA